VTHKYISWISTLLKSTVLYFLVMILIDLIHLNLF
jgi:hypothetical protein